MSVSNEYDQYVDTLLEVIQKNEDPREVSNRYTLTNNNNPSDKKEAIHFAYKKSKSVRNNCVSKPYKNNVPIVKLCFTFDRIFVYRRIYGKPSLVRRKVV
jgi:hypothetical protein